MTPSKTSTIRIYAPDSEPGPEFSWLAPNPTSLAGLRIAVLDNGKPNASLVMERVADLLAARVAATKSLVIKKGPNGRSANAAIPCAADVFAHVIAESDLVITGTADCGSCTAYSVYDAIETRKSRPSGRCCHHYENRADCKDNGYRFRLDGSSGVGLGSSDRGHSWRHAL